MTFLYDTWYSVVFRRLKKVKLPTQSAEKGICMGKWAEPTLANFNHEVVVISRVPLFLTVIRLMRHIWRS